MLGTYLRFPQLREEVKAVSGASVFNSVTQAAFLYSFSASSSYPCGIAT